METSITFYLQNEDKQRIIEASKKLSVGFGTYCRLIVLNQLNQMEANQTPTS